MKDRCRANCLILAGLLLAAGVPAAWASSHREAPAITRNPQVDATDFYMFRSYEEGREGFITLIANYNPLQDAYGGPNYFQLDPDGIYDIHITNDGDPDEDITFRFRFFQQSPFISLSVGDSGSQETVAIPLVNAGTFGAGDEAALNVLRSYTVRILTGDVDSPDTAQLLRDASNGSSTFPMPYDNIGNKSVPDYDAYAATFVRDAIIPGCANGRVFVGQRKESFAVNLGEIFDLVNVTDPLGARDAEASDLADKNITTFAIEVPIDCLTGGTTAVIGGWTTGRLRTVLRRTDTPTFDDPEEFLSADLTQVSRLGMPLVNEVVIGLPDKNLFNASDPSADAQFLSYVTHPTLPELLEILFGGAGVQAPNNFPRNDLVTAFLTGVPGLNADGAVGEYQRLNISVSPLPAAMQNDLGVVGGDAAGFPNGRRPGDDVVDIALRVAMGLLCHLSLGVCDPADAPSGLLPFTDGSMLPASQFDDQFPYLTTPIPGSPNLTP